MEKLKTRNEYVGCNRKCRFYADEIKAVSYSWWNFVNVINGKVIFNNYSYSPTTTRHQRAIYNLMNSLNIKIDCKVNMSESLTQNNFEAYALDHYYETYVQLMVQNNTPRVRQKTKDDNILRMYNIKNKIKELKSIGATSRMSKILYYYKRYKEQRDNREKKRIEFKKKIKLVDKKSIYRTQNNKRYKYNRCEFETNKIIFKGIDAKKDYFGNTIVYHINEYKDYLTVCPLSTALYK